MIHFCLVILVLFLNSGCKTSSRTSEVLVPSALGSQTQEHTLEDRPYYSLFVSYRKDALACLPVAKWNAPVEKRTLTFQPNVGPGAGLTYQHNAYLGASFYRSIVPLEPDRNRRGSSTVTQLELHWLSKNIGVDLYHHRAEGGYVDAIAPRDVTPLRDSLFSRDDVKGVFPDLLMTSTAADFLFNFDSEAFSLQAAMEHETTTRKTGWSLFAMVGFAERLFTNASSIVPADYRSSYSSDLRGAFLQSIHASPGIGGMVPLSPRWYVSGLGFAGLLYTRFNYVGDNKRMDSGYGTSVNGRATLGWDSGTTFAGIKVYRHVQSLDAAAFHLAYGHNDLSFFVGQRL